ncbi:DNA/RNA helicase domain-containing protein [Pediococcus pentosaceus]|uniref:DNA/RNA helicase domain-containing protein n=1 Tax=Pediococcus pentosaceus TaxID=1255 RepID=UPI0018A1386D|nr:DNA/RNA helicase domain-containing protein [Pediococcus pentosaceus]MBF7137938.1 Flp pilus assembly complex ATPase component TadA [Pediococcus pentosaceus]
MSKREKSISTPIIGNVPFSEDGLKQLEKIDNKKLLLEYPTVYIIYSERNGMYQVYVGETNNIKQRTKEHFREGNRYTKGSNMFVIGHEHFNKSLTLDIENKFMLYLTGNKFIKKLSNKRDNPQYRYFPYEEMNQIFSKSWKKLRKNEQSLFPIEKVIEDNALFKASPFHKLTMEQFEARDKIINRVKEVLNKGNKHQLILVEGAAGSGKTVLLSSLFYALSEENNENTYMLVNHDEQVKVYNNIAKKLGLQKRLNEKVMKPTSFIINDKFVDEDNIVLVDEAHLLWTQGKQSYQGQNQLQDIIKKSRITIAVFDPQQVLRTQQYVEDDDLRKIEENAKNNGNLIELKKQLRMNASQETINWIKTFVYQQEIIPLPENDAKYDLKIFDDPREMYEQLKIKNQNQESGLSRILATFDWEFKEKKSGTTDLYKVEVDGLSLPWNNQLKSSNKYLSWAERPETINEAGSTYTIQGFDLNYSAVIIGPSVKYRDGKVIYDPDFSANRNAVSNRTLKNGKKQKVYDTLLPNELNVLLTRGINGLYIYAVDDELRIALLSAQGQ